MKILASVALSVVCACALELGSDMQNYINELKKEALAENSSFKDFSAERGKEIFTSVHVGKEDKKISCESCHGSDLAQKSQNIFTGKEIEALSPKANPSRLSDVKEVKKWLKRNFKDVYLREGTALEKGDALYYIMSK